MRKLAHNRSLPDGMTVLSGRKAVWWFIRWVLLFLILSIIVSPLKLREESTLGINVARANGTEIDGFGMGSSIHLRVGANRIDEALNQQQAMGVRWAREEIAWGEIELTQDNFRWAYPFGTTPRDYDVLLNELEERDIEMVALLTYGPSYLFEPTPQELLARWENWVQVVVDRYGDRIDYWEIENEMNSPLFWGKVVFPELDREATPDPTLYAQMLESAYRIIKAHDRDDVVILGGLVYHLGNACNLSDPFVYLGALEEAGAWDSFDVLAIHPYRGASPEEFVDGYPPYNPVTYACQSGQMMSDSQIGEIRALQDLAQVYGSKPIWVTEVGWAQEWLEPIAGWRGTSADIVEADFLVRTYVPLLSEPGVEKVFWYTQYDDPNIPGCVLGSEGQHALGMISELLTGSEPLGQFQGQDDRGRAEDDDAREYRFSRDDELIIVAWKARGGDVPREVTISDLEEIDTVLLYDLNAVDLSPESGQELAVTDGEVTIDLTERPVFLVAERPGIFDSTLEEIERQLAEWWEEQKAKVEAWIDEQRARLEGEFDEWIEELERRMAEIIETELERFIVELCGTAWLPPGLVAVIVWIKRRRRGETKV